jgi:chromatin remodeling complex protein RSC6
MVAAKREQAPTPGQKRLKLEKDHNLEHAGRVSVKNETKLERQSVVKAEQRAHSSVKAEQAAAVKTEPRTAATGSIDQNLPPLAAKVEQLRKLGASKIKAELLKEADKQGISGLIERGMAIRAKLKDVKREKGTRGKKNASTKFLKVKKERSRNADGKMRKKTRYTAKGRKARREVMAREVALSDELGEVLGSSALSRPEAVKQLWAYCRENGMLNPENKREILFDVKLEQMMGQKTAKMTDLISLLTPHFDYTQAVVKQEVKKESGRGVKVEAKKEQHKTVKHEAKKEKSCTKQEQLSASNSATKCVKHEVAPGRDKEIVRDALADTFLQISRFEHTSVVIECRAPPGNVLLEAVAKPIGTTGLPESRAPCSVEFREDQRGVFEPRVEAKLGDLDPKLAYHITVRMCDDGGCSHQALLPQRAHPEKWSSQDVATWCQSMHVPELLHMAQQYAIDGPTLLSLGEEDLKASGLTAPFLMRRTLAGLDALRACGS